MAKAITSRTESLTIRVPVDLLAVWKAEAIARNISVAALILGKMRITQTSTLVQTPIADAIHACKTDQAIDPKASHPSGPVLTDPRPQNIQGQATGYRPKGAWKADKSAE